MSDCDYATKERFVQLTKHASATITDITLREKSGRQLVSLSWSRITSASPVSQDEHGTKYQRSFWGGGIRPVIDSQAPNLTV
jgi:hypothetical protein